MSIFVSSLPVLRQSSCCRHRSLSQRLFSWRRRCRNGFSLQVTQRNRLKGFLVTGASAAACAVIYFSLKPQNPVVAKDIINIDTEEIWSYFTVATDVCCQNKEIDLLDLFFEVGYVEDWLACPLSSLVSHSRAVNESSAFIKPNIAELLFPWEQAKSDDPWVLLQLTRSSNFWVRQMGVACLADKTNWEGYKYRNVAQACDYRTVIALARYPHANDAFFFPLPKLCQPETDVVTELQSLVGNMPESETIKSNIAFYRASALQKDILFQKDPFSMDLLTHFYTTPAEEEKKVNQKLRHCLQALEAYTLEEENCRHFINLQGLAVLQRLLESIKDDWVQTFILIILNNLSQIPDLGKQFVHTGWISQLRRWSKGSDKAFSIMADTILVNLDRDWITPDLYCNMILLHPTQRNSIPVYADIVLVHGLKGGAVKTWRQGEKVRTDSKPSDYCYCWPKDWLSHEFKGVRVISIGYNSSLHQWGDECPYESERRTLEGRSTELVDHLLKAGVGSRPIVWMGHSMGGLLIKEILCLCENSPGLQRICKKTKGVVMYSVPHRGAPLVDTSISAKYILFPSVEVQEMSTHSSKLKTLHEDFLKIVSDKNIPCLSFGESIKTDFGKPFPSFFIVPEESSDPGIGQYVSLPTNHIQICKPCDKNDPIYLQTVKFIKEAFKGLI